MQDVSSLTRLISLFVYYDISNVFEEFMSVNLEKGLSVWVFSTFLRIGWNIASQGSQGAMLIAQMPTPLRW